jgi:predicted nucleic acid-binding protein
LLSGGLAIVRTTPNEELRAQEILAQYSEKDWSLCDTISFAVLEMRHIRRVFTFDRHFRHFRQFGRFEVLGLKM